MAENSDERVAVIAVHGVAYHAPNQSAREIAGLLTPLRDHDEYLKYAPWEEVSVRIAVREVDGELLDMPVGELPADIEFSKKLLEKYQPKGKETTYQTVCLQGNRVRREGDDSYRKQRVDIYEMYWNDLSKVAEGNLGPLNTLYLLLFHLCDVGLNTIENALSEQDKSKVQNWSTAYKIAGRIFTDVIPQLNLVLLMLLVGVIPLTMEGTDIERLVGGVGALLGIGLPAFLIYKQGRRIKNTGLNALIFVVCVLLGVLGYLGAVVWAKNTPYIAITACGGGIILSIMTGLFVNFNRIRPGAIRTGSIFLGLATLGVVIEIFILGNGKQQVAGAFLQVGLIGLSTMAFIWLCFLILAVGAMVWGALWARGSGKNWRVWWTAWITLWGPAALFLYLTETIWLIFATAAPSLMKGVTVARWPHMAEWYFLGFPIDPAITGIGEIIREKMGHLLSVYFGWGVALVGGSVLPALWAFLPSILFEQSPPEAKASTGGQEEKRRWRNLADTGQGNWLTQGYRLMKISGVLICLSILVRLLSFLPHTAPLNLDSVLKVLQGVIGKLGISPGAAGAVGVGVLVAVYTAITRLFGRLGSVVGVALDVDNHLREVPEDHTPRAKMAARYASLLRYLGRQGYSKIIIVAHSQGTVLTADLLRLLNAYVDKMEDKEPALQRLLKNRQLTFLTMGSPLRQLYALRFPDLYSWAINPDHKTLGVAAWMNFYRSGDYVGRGLWEDNHANQWLSNRSRWVAPRTGETCIGTGAHTHYWDETAPEVADFLDALIAEPGSGAKPDLPTRLNNAAQRVEKIAGELGKVVMGLDEIVDAEKARLSAERVS